MQPQSREHNRGSVHAAEGIADIGTKLERCAVGQASEMSHSSVSAQRLPRLWTRRERVLWRTVRTVMARRTPVRDGLLEFLPGPACSA